MADTILMMDDDMEDIIPANVTNQPVTPSPAQPVAPPAGDGGTVIDPVAVQKPNQIPSFTEAIEGANIPQKGPTSGNNANSGQTPATPTQQPTAPQQAATTPPAQKQKMSRKKKIIIAAAAGLAGIAGIAAAATMLKKGSDDGLGEGESGGDSVGDNLFGGLSGTSIQGDDLSFSQAFGNARSELGANGVFKWRGQLYGTMLKDEWDGLSNEGRQQFAQESQSVSLDNDFPDNDVNGSDDAVAVMDADDIDPVVEGEPMADDDEVIEGELVDDDEVVEGELVDDDDEVIEGEPVDDNDVVEGELVDDDEVIEGEPVDDDEVIDGEPIDDEEDFIDDDMNEEEVIDDNIDEDYADYMNDEDASDFV